MSKKLLLFYKIGGSTGIVFAKENMTPSPLAIYCSSSIRENPKEYETISSSIIDGLIIGSCIRD